MNLDWQTRVTVSALQDMGRDLSLSVIDIGESAIAGVSAALTATVILGIARIIHRWQARRRDVNYVRGILSEGEALVFGAEESFSQHANAISTKDAHRAAEYNRMLEKLRVALGNWAPNLSHIQRRDLFDALDWYHTENLLAVFVKGNMQYIRPEEGKWYGQEMPEDVALTKFERLRLIKWLKQ